MFLNTKMISLFFLLILFVSLTEQTIYQCNPKAECGCSQNPVSMNARIVNGETAGDKTWSWAVSLEIGTSLCGGTIISSSYILTAGHCIDGESSSSITAYVGSTDLQKGEARTVSRIYKHPNYYADPLGQYIRNDMALLKLTTQLNLNDSSLAKVCLPKGKTEMDSSTKLMAIGWGTKYEGASFASGTLQQVTLDYVDYDKWCSRVAVDATNQFCAGIMPLGGKDTCQGDSGGPLMTFNSNKLWEIQGVVSYGKGCARPALPGVYARVDSYLAWITNIIETDPAPSSSSMLFSFNFGSLFLFMIINAFFYFE